MDTGVWLFGYGLTHFPVFVKTNLGFYGSDPHNWILSAAGIFGILGLLFYFVLTKKLIRKSHSFETKERAIALCLLLFFIGRELANTQYVLNNNPMCCLYWISISLVFFSSPQPVSHDAVS
jgi:predicted tellurium resistance membrane protein TerC